MDNERVREICLALPHVKETLNWGHHLVYWAGDRKLGGKMFAMTDLDGTGSGVLWFHAGAERFDELLEIDGIIPSPYLAKAYWVTLEHWNVLRPRQIEEELRQAHMRIFAKLPKRTRVLLEPLGKESGGVLDSPERLRSTGLRRSVVKAAPASKGAAKKSAPQGRSLRRSEPSKRLHKT